MYVEIATALISSIVGGLLVAIVNHLFTRKKTYAEIEKLKAETQKTLAEAEKIRGEVKYAIGEASYYYPAEVNERVIYDSTHGIHEYDIKSQFSQYAIQQGILLIQDADLELILRKYVYDSKEFEFIPKNELIAGERKFRVSCELKVIGATYEVNIFLWDDLEEQDSLDDRVTTVTNTDWRKIDLYFRARPDQNYLVHILATRVSEAGSLQIRNLIVAEHIN